MRYLGILLIVLIMLTACTNDADNPPAPTIAPTSIPTTTVPSITPTRPPINTLPPTWTAAPSTPTRTPGGGANVVPVQSTATAPFFTGTLPPVDPICEVFAADQERNLLTEQVDPNREVTIFWTPIPETGYTYRVILLHPAGMNTVEQETDQAQFTFLPEMLNSPGFTFGWEVQPLLFGELTCFPISGEIFINPVFEE